MFVIDSHCHLTDKRFEADRDDVISRAKTTGISEFIVPATRVSDWQAVQSLARNNTDIHPAFGLHPWFNHHEEDLKQLPVFLQRAVAVGECGLDSALSDIDMEKQLYFFRAQLKLAFDFNLPVIIHAYKTIDLTISELKNFPDLKGVIHSFSGSLQQAEKLIQRGFYLGFGGNVTYPRANRLRTLLQQLPLESLLLETDAPDQPICSQQGKRNEPSFLIEIARQIATLRQIETDQLISSCNCNARELFKL